MAYQHGRRPDEASAAMGGTNNTHDAAMHHDTAQIQTHLRQLEQQNKQQTERITHLEQQLKEYEEVNARGMKELDRVNYIVEKSKDKKALKTALEEKDYFQEQAQALQKLIREMNEEMEQYKRRVEELESGKESSSAIEDQEKLQERVNSLKDQIQELQDEISKKKAASEGENDEQSHNTTTVEQLQDDLEHTKVELAETEAKLNNDKETELRAIRTRERLARKRREQKEQLESALIKKTNECVELQQRISEVEDAHSADLDRLQNKLRETETELRTTRENLEEANKQLQSYQSNKGSNSVEFNEKQRQELVRQLEHLRKEHEKQISKMRKDLENEKKKEMVTMKKEALEEAQAKVQNDLGKGKDDSRKIEELQEEIQTLKESLKEATTEKESAETQVEDLREKLIRTESKVTKATATATDMEKKLESTQAELKHARSSKEALQEQVDELEKTKEELQDKLESIREERDALSGSLDELQSKKQDLESEVTKLSNELSQHRDQVKSIQTERDEYKNRVNDAEERRTEAETKLEQLQNDHKVAVKQHRQIKKGLSQEVSKLKRRLEEYEKKEAEEASNSVADDDASEARNDAPTTPKTNSHFTSNSSETGSVRSHTSDNEKRHFEHSLKHEVPAMGRSATGESEVSVERDSKPSLVQKLKAKGKSAFSPDPSLRSPMTSSAQFKREIMWLRQSLRSAAKTEAEFASRSNDETIRILGDRLTNVLSDCEHTKERVKMLENIVQDLQQELDEKRRLLNGLTTSKIGITSSLDDGTVEVNGQRLSAESKGLLDAAIKQVRENPEAVKSLLTKTLAEIERLRHDMKLMASETQESQ